MLHAMVLRDGEAAKELTKWIVIIIAKGVPKWNSCGVAVLMGPQW